jgi:hypothetical protein
VGDEVVATQAGTHTYGLDRFFASLYGKPVPGRAFFTLALVSVQARRSLPLRVEQVVRSDAEKAASQAQAAAKKAQAPGAKRWPGRPKGSKNTPQADGSCTPELVRIPGWLDALLPRIAGVVSLTYVVWDGHFGTHNARRRARQHNLHLIAKLRCDAALSFPYTGPYAGRGPHRQSGDKVDCDARPLSSRTETTVAGQVKTGVYQMPLLHKECAQPLHVVIIVQINLRTQARAHVILLSSDVAWAYAPLVDYDGLRFQRAFNFRDAKQSWGLEDCMHVTPPGGTSAANLSLFMGNGAYRLRADRHPRDPAYSVLDLKADCRGSQDVEETIKLLPEKPEPIFLAKMCNQVASLGRMHTAQPSFSFASLAKVLHRNDQNFIRIYETLY